MEEKIFLLMQVVC